MDFWNTSRFQQSSLLYILWWWVGEGYKIRSYVPPWSTLHFLDEKIVYDYKYRQVPSHRLQSSGLAILRGIWQEIK